VYGIEWSRARSEEMRDGRQVNLATGAVTNVVGTDVFPTRDFPVSRLDRIGVFAQDKWSLGSLSLIPALRYDRFEMRPEPDAVYLARNPGRPAVGLTDDAWSPKLGVLVPLGDAMQATFQAAAGFRSPPSFDVNVGLSNLPLGFTVIPNPDLRPEKSRGLELGLRGRHGSLDWSATAFSTRYSDLIVSRAPLVCPGDPRCVPGAPITFQSQNVTSARIQGVELRAQARLAPEWTLKAGGAWTRGDDRTRGVPLNTIDPAKVVEGLAWERGGHGVELIATHVVRKERIDQSAGTLFATPAFTVVDLVGWTRLARGVTLHAGLFNAFDEKHWLWSDVRGILNPNSSIDRYTQPGRNFGVQVKVEF
jgi:hemoglobin/transferrin/lactoferrin receptor protein